LVQHNCKFLYIPDCNHGTMLNNRQFRRLRQPSNRGRPPKQRTLLSLELPCTLSLKSRDMSPCCWVEPFPSISCSHQMRLTGSVVVLEYRSIGLLEAAPGVGQGAHACQWRRRP
ncbi:hypothetical protein BAE44_0025829, partial [Dichanthelium oligosanthes]